MNSIYFGKRRIFIKISARMTKLTYTIVAFLSFFLNVHAQDLNLKFRHLTVDQGLPHTDVTGMVQDAKGFVWLGTYAGLSRYDGYEIKTFVNKNSQLKQVYFNRINEMAIAADGKIWLATQGGLVLFDPSKEQFSTFEASNVLINHVISDNEGVVYTAINNQLLAYRLDNNKQLQKIDIQGFNNNSIISAFRKDVHGTIWATCTDGVLHIQNNGNNRIIERISVKDQNQKLRTNITALFFSPSGKMIIGVHEGYILIENWAVNQSVFTGQFVEIPPSVWNVPKDQNFSIISLAEDTRSGTVWVASEYGIAKLADWKTGRILQKLTGTTQPNLSSNHISQLFTDRSGALWIMSYGGGADILDLNRKQFHNIRRDENNPLKSMSDDYARALLEDDKGNLWIGTRNEGVNIVNLKTNEWRFLRHQDNSNATISSNRIRALAKDRQGRVWIGTDVGLDIYDGSATFAKITSDPNNKNSLTTNVIFSLDVDVFGQVWAGSWDNGVNRIRYQSPQNYQIEQIVKGENGLCGSKVSFVYADPKAPEVFVGTTEGLNHIFLNSEGGVSKIYHYKGVEGNTQTLNSNFIWPIVRTDAKTLWVGTLGGGLNKVTLLGEGKYIAQHITTTEGLPSNDVESLLTDAQGNLWLGGKGLTMVNPETKELVKFDANDGLQSNVFKIGSAYAGRDGRLYFGGIQGVTYFYPDSITRNKEKLTPVLTGLTINNQRVAVGEKIENNVPLEAEIGDIKELLINHLQNNFVIHFSTLQFLNPEKCRFRYQLIGFDKDWVEVDASQRMASYSNLDYGSYTFRLLASNSDGFWGDKPIELMVQVLPPWWASIWAKLVYLLIVLGLAYGAYSWFILRRDLHIQRVEERKTDELHRLRLQFFTNISHELRTPLSLITVPIEKLISNVQLSEATRMRHYDLIQRNAQRLLNLVNELLEFRKVESGTRRLRATQTNLSAFVQNICEEFEEIAERRDIQFNINLDKNNQETIWLDRAVIEKIIVNLLSNAFKYNRPVGTVTVEICENDAANFKNELKLVIPKGDNLDFVWLRVADTGIGLTEGELEHVFDRYYRVTESEQDGQPGSGIGLAFVRSLVTLHHGCISVYSTKDEGTEFYIGLPRGKAYLKPEEILVADETTTPSVSMASERSDLVEESLHDVETTILNQNQKASNKPRLLIVEDNAELRTFLAESFADSYRILVAQDGEMGLKTAKEAIPDAIISDIMMPKMDGIELCQAVRATIAISHIPFILLTAKNSVQSRIDAADVAADAYIAKPFSLRLLQATITNLLETRQKLKERYSENHLFEVHELTTNKRDQDFLSQMMSIIERNLEDSDFDVEKISREMGTSRTVLYDKVNALTGKSVGEFVRKMRINTAAHILVTEDLPINLVMDRVGIQSPSYFSKAFKKEFGKTPSQYLQDFIAEKKTKAMK